MADITYTVNQDTPQSIPNVEIFSQEDTTLANTFQINQLFDSTRHSVELHIYNLAGELLESEYNYTNYKELGNAASAGKEGASVLTIDPVADVELYEYDNGGVKLLYNFVDDLYTDSRETVEFFIDSISPDRTELRLKTFNLTPEEVLSFTNNIKAKLETLSYFNEFRVNFLNNDLFIGVNIDTLQEIDDTVVTVKLYEPLPDDIVEKSTLSIVELVSDSVVYEVTTTFTSQEEPTLELRSPNFNLDLVDESTIPTEYYNYDTLLSLPISNTTNELYSLVNSKGVQLSIDHNDYSNFVHFSSAQERLLNFKYKLDLIQSYNTQIASFQTVTTPSLGTTGSLAYYEGLVKGIVSNFDHYERFLYYESGSNSWPKTNNTKPYINDTTSGADTWFSDKQTVAATYDATNTNILINSVPTYLRDDSANASYITFIHMIAQHFDNMWIYAKGVSDKYNADNRLDFGVSRDLVAEVLKNFGVKLYTSNKSVEDLFSTFIGQAYQSGSEVINNYVTGSITGSNDSIQPSSFDNYQREVYKRMYHNLPLLLKSKGTERGLRALVNCFGIPSDILDIKLYGGRNVNERPFYGDYQYYTSSLDKIRLDHTGSIVTGSTLSEYTSILKRDYKYTDDLHPIEVGFSPTDNVNNYIISKSLSTGSLSSFNIDEYLGDPRNLYLDNYYNIGPSYNITGSLILLTDQIMSGSDAYNVQDFVRLIKFFDNTIFKMVKDFIPARSTADTGIIIKPHLLQRSKAKSVILSGSQPEYSASIDTAFIQGTDGSSFGANDDYNTSYTYGVQTPQGILQRTYYSKGAAKYDGELSGSYIQTTTGELNTQNIYKKDNPVSENKYITLIQDFPGNICVLASSYAPITITSHSSRDISLDFSSLGTSGVVFTSASVDITSQQAAFDFPTTNYIQHIITASNSSISSCSGSITYTTAYCDIAISGSNPASIITGSLTLYNLTTWFTTGSNTNTSFTASWDATVEGIPDPSNYQFTQPTGSVTITRRDNIIASCSQSISINIIGQAYTCVFLKDLIVLENAEDPGAPASGSYTYIPCNGGEGGSPVTVSWFVATTPNDVKVNRCVADGTVSIEGPATPFYTTQSCV
jgi:hypothetical protein